MNAVHMTPDIRTALALASITRHAEELLDGGHAADEAAISGLLSLPYVRGYMASLDAMAPLPVRR